jgi:hypothetical protein
MKKKKKPKKLIYYSKQQKNYLRFLNITPQKALMFFLEYKELKYIYIYSFSYLHFIKQLEIIKAALINNIICMYMHYSNSNKLVVKTETSTVFLNAFLWVQRGS